MIMKKLLFTIAAVASLSAMNAQIGEVNSVADIEVTAQSDDIATADHTLTVNVAAVALLDIHTEGTTDEVVDIEFNLNGDTNEAGLYSFDDLTAPKVILNHTFVPSAAVVGAGANIDVELSELIPGINVNVVASNENLGLFVGQPGAPVITSQVVTVQGVSLRTGVEASYTGSAGGSSGTGLVYSLSLNNDATFGNLREQTYERILTYSFSAL